MQRIQRHPKNKYVHHSVVIMMDHIRFVTPYNNQFTFPSGQPVSALSPQE